MRRTVLVTFLAIAALGLLVAFAFNSRSVPVEAHVAHHTISLELTRAQQDFRALVTTLGTAMAESERPDDGAIAVQQRLTSSPGAVRPEIGRLPGNASVSARIGNSLEVYEQAVAGAGELIGELIESQSAYADSVAFLRDSGPNIIERMRDIALERAAADAFQLIVGTLDYAAPQSTVDGSELKRLHMMLTRDQRLDANMPNETRSLLAAAGVVLDSKAGIRSRFGQLAEAPVASAAANLAMAVNDAYGTAVAAADSARMMLAVYAIVLFAAVGFVGFRLQSSYSQINLANAELATLNESLEQRVTERTAELSTALTNLKESQVQLVQAEKMSSLGQLVAGISHEINTPLLYLANNAALVSERIELLNEFVRKCAMAFALDRTQFADRSDYQARFVELLLALKKMLREDELEAATEEARDLMKDSIEGLGDLTEMAQSLKDFSRLDRAPTGSFDVNSGIEKTLTIARNVVKDKAEIHKHFAELPDIECSPSKINQVFLNLITNAAQAIEGHGEIVIRTRRHDEEHVAISISDSGCGISEENLARVRDPFFTTKEVGTGTGLGLSIVDEIVRSHGGELLIESKVGSGSTFTVVLPILQSPVRDPLIDDIAEAAEMDPFGDSSPSDGETERMAEAG